MTSVLARVSRSLGPALPVVGATVVLLIVSPLVVPGSLGQGPLATMLPFTAILAIAAMGQTLVIQQGGVDFSVAGTISLSAVLLTKFADQQTARIIPALLVVLAAAALIGLTNALFIARLRVTPIIATLGVNALVLGAIRRYSGGQSVPPAPAPLKSFALGKTLGLHNPVWVALLLIAVGTVLVKRTIVGRRFEVVGASPAAARVGGIPVGIYQASAYVGASLVYAVAGILLASFLSAPRIDAGEPYLLSAIAATVIGGTALSGGVSSLVGAGVGALFLTQLGQLLLGLGLDTSVNFVVQGGVIAASMGIRTVHLAVQRGRARDRALRDSAGSSPSYDEALLVGGQL